VFGRKGDNLTLDVPVTFTEAALGAEIEVPDAEGPRVGCGSPPGTPNGRTIRVRGKGVRRRRTAPTADLLVTVKVQCRSDLSDEAKAALKEYAEKAPQGNPRAALFGG
jgi:molecular chaperone DnaJ